MLRVDIVGRFRVVNIQTIDEWFHVTGSLSKKNVFVYILQVDGYGSTCCSIQFEFKKRNSNSTRTSSEPKINFLHEVAVREML